MDTVGINGEIGGLGPGQITSQARHLLVYCLENGGDCNLPTTDAAKTIFHMAMVAPVLDPSLVTRMLELGANVNIADVHNTRYEIFLCVSNIFISNYFHQPHHGHHQPRGRAAGPDLAPALDLHVSDPDAGPGELQPPVRPLEVDIPGSHPAFTGTDLGRGGSIILGTCRAGDQTRVSGTYQHPSHVYQDHGPIAVVSAIVRLAMYQQSPREVAQEENRPACSSRVQYPGNKSRDPTRDISAGGPRTRADGARVFARVQPHHESGEIFLCLKYFRDYKQLFSDGPQLCRGQLRGRHHVDGPAHVWSTCRWTPTAGGQV